MGPINVLNSAFMEAVGVHTVNGSFIETPNVSCGMRGQLRTWPSLEHSGHNLRQYLAGTNHISLTCCIGEPFQPNQSIFGHRVILNTKPVTPRGAEQAQEWSSKLLELHWWDMGRVTQEGSERVTGNSRCML